jgi:hypothetical protein
MIWRTSVTEIRYERKKQGGIVAKILRYQNTGEKIG